MLPIEQFWCCLREEEKQAWEFAGLTYAASPGIYLLKLTYDFIFASLGAYAAQRQSLWAWSVGLTLTEITFEGETVEVYLIAGSRIPEYLDFWVAAEFGCDCRCQQMRFPEPC